jgi:hypothetical protein
VAAGANPVICAAAPAGRISDSAAAASNNVGRCMFVARIEDRDVADDGRPTANLVQAGRDRQRGRWLALARVDIIADEPM